MITVSRTVGRLVEVRICTPVIGLEIVAMAQAVSAEVAKVRVPIVGITDLRAATVFPVELADQVAVFFRHDSPHIARSGMLTTGGATFAMQIARVLREAPDPNRRSFSDRFELEAWLGEVLTPEERRRMNTFLNEGQ